MTGRGLILAILAVATLISLPLRALAWGAEGHRIIAHLAYERLTPKTRMAVDSLLSHAVMEDTPRCPVASLEDASTWPDCVRGLHDHRFKYLSPMHYEDVPLCGTAAKASYCPRGECVTAEISRAIAFLKDRRRSPIERLQALEEVTHFIGDLHQPLHAADNNDRGGNEDQVEFGDQGGNLHHLWDTELVRYAVGPSEAQAEDSLRPLVSQHADEWAVGDLDSWIFGSHDTAVTITYGALEHTPACGRVAPGQAISHAYLERAAPVVREQLAKAAVRLARVLTEALS